MIDWWLGANQCQQVNVRVPKGKHGGESFEFTQFGEVFTAKVLDGYEAGDFLKVAVPASMASVPAGYIVAPLPEVL